MRRARHPFLRFLPKTCATVYATSSEAAGNRNRYRNAVDLRKYWTCAPARRSRGVWDGHVAMVGGRHDDRSQVSIHAQVGASFPVRGNDLPRYVCKVLITWRLTRRRGAPRGRLWKSLPMPDVSGRPGAIFEQGRTAHRVTGCRVATEQPDGQCARILALHTGQAPQPCRARVTSAIAICSSRVARSARAA